MPMRNQDLGAMELSLLSLSLRLLKAEFLLLSLLYSGLHRGSNMRLSPLLGKLHLALTLGEATGLFLGMFVIAMVTANALPIVLAVLVLFSNGTTAGMALIVIALFQLMVNRHSIVENKAFTLPSTISFRLLFQVF